MYEDDERTLLEKLEIPQLDMRDFTRKGPTLTKIYLVDYLGVEHLWITVGRIEFNEQRNYTVVGARMGQGATDFEHDSAWAFRIPVIGLEPDFGLCYQSIFHFNGWIATPQSGLDLNRLSLPEGNPLDALEGDNTDPEKGGAYMCEDEHCPKPHPVIRYASDTDPELGRKLYGRKICIKSGFASE